ncbi:bacterioferritin [Candidatus Bipolaricaulota bacterium]|nr:bacterioferritin [Candidatus Bipolaricaulota bacterium]
MKGDPKIIEALNKRVAEELAAVLQYMVHAELCENWGYKKLAEVIEKRAITEMRHWEKLVQRIIFLEGQPIVTNIAPVHIASDVEKIHQNDLQAEYEADKAYNETIKLAAELGDNGTKVLLEEILKDEEEHIDWLEAQLDEIKQMGLQNYLTEQMEE